MEQPPADAQLVSEYAPTQLPTNSAAFALALSLPPPLSFLPLILSLPAHFVNVNAPFGSEGWCRYKISGATNKVK